MTTLPRIPVFDLDGTLVDSDEALIAPFVALGVDRADITFGHVLDDECERLGISVEAYLDCYDEAQAQPFPGVAEMVVELDRWAVCSNKHARAGHAELARLGWRPEVVRFSDSFDGPKELAPVLEAMALGPDAVAFIGDTAHDRLVAEAVGVPFALAGWNPRARPERGDTVLASPADLWAFLAT